MPFVYGKARLLVMKVGLHQQVFFDSVRFAANEARVGVTFTGQVFFAPPKVIPGLPGVV
jgi:hypothetical protein